MANRIAIAAVCHPEAARPFNGDFSPVASTTGEGLCSKSRANRLISSRVINFPGLLIRIPTARSSNHSITDFLHLVWYSNVHVRFCGQSPHDVFPANVCL